MQVSVADAGDDSAEPDAAGAESGEIDESAESADAGLVGRITSTIFGR